MNPWLILSACITAVVSIALFPSLVTTNNWKYVELWKGLWSSSSSSVVVAELLVTNGSIYTSDSSHPFADSMAVAAGKVLRLGTFSSLQDLVGHETKVLNLDRNIVVPGFIDSHVHLIFGGLQMASVEFRGVSSKDEFVKKVKDAVANLKHGCWVLGGGWNNDLWDGELPEASWIDGITPNNPVWLSRMDGHMGLANSLAIRLAGIPCHARDPDGGAIMRAPSGEPTGLLVDSAMELVFSLIPEVSVDERRGALLRASNLALKRGVTTVVDFGRYFPGASEELPWDDFSEVYTWADFSGEMKTRVCLFFPMTTWSRLKDLIHEQGRKLSQWLYLGGVKAFSDASLGSNSALFYESYFDDPNNCGLQVTDTENLYNMTVLSDESGLQVAIHSIGDRANDLILDMYKSVASKNGIRDRRFRIEHAQHLAPGAADRFGEEGIVASLQPNHLLSDAASAIRKLGEERAQTGSYLFKSLQASNAILAFGSDWPVADINPLSSIKTAIRRIPPGWDNPWISSERISLRDALNAYTLSAARACFLDKDVGSLSPGKYADFVVLSANLWTNFEVEESVSVKSTYVNGLRAYPSI